MIRRVIPPVARLSLVAAVVLTTGRWTIASPTGQAIPLELP